MATHVSPEAQMFFIYDHTYLQKEEDDLKDAIIYFAPNTVDINEQCALCGQLMGMVGFFKHFSGTSPSFFRLRTEVFVVKHVGKYTLAMAGDLQEPEASLKKKLDNLYTCFTFFMGNLELLFQVCDSDREKFVSTMQAVWDCYLPFSRFYGDAVSAAFESLPVIDLPKSGANLFIKASNLLQASQRRPGVLAGCLFFKNRVLITQLSQDLTARLLLIKPQQTHLPCQIFDPDFNLPKGVRVLSVYLTADEYFSLTPWFSKVRRRHYATTDFRKNAKDVRYSSALDVFRSSSAGSQATLGSSTDTTSDSSKSPSGCGNAITDSFSEITCTMCNTPLQEGFNSEHDGDELRNSTGSLQRMVQLQRMRDVSPSLSDYSSVFNSPQSIFSSSSNSDLIPGQKEDQRQEARNSGCSKRQACIDLNKDMFESVKSSLNQEGHMQGELEEKDQSRISLISSDSEISFAEVTTEPSIENKSFTVPSGDAEGCNKDTNETALLNSVREEDEDENGTDSMHLAELEASTDKTLTDSHPSCAATSDEDAAEPSQMTVGTGSIDSAELPVLRGETVGSSDPAEFSNVKASMHNTSAGIVSNVCDKLVPSDDFHTPSTSDSAPCGDKNGTGSVAEGSVQIKLDKKFESERTEILPSKENGGSENVGQPSLCGDEEKHAALQSCEDTKGSKSQDDEQDSLHIDPDVTQRNGVSGCERKTVSHIKSQHSQNIDSVEQSKTESYAVFTDETCHGVNTTQNNHTGLGSSTQVFHFDNSLEEECKTINEEFDEVGVDVSDSQISSKTSSYECEDSNSQKRESKIESQPYDQNGERGDSVFSNADSPQISFKNPTLERQTSRKSQSGSKPTMQRQLSRRSQSGSKEKPPLFERQSSRRSQDGSKCPPGVLLANKVAGKEVPGLENVTLYIQGHSDMVLLLLMDRAARQDAAAMQALWKYALPHLADLEVQLKGCVRDAPKPVSDGSYNFLRYDTFQRSLKGTIVNPVSSLENEFYDGACLMHEEFQKSDTVRDITLRNQTCCLYGHQNINDETYFQILNVPRGILWGADPMATIEKKAKKVLLRDHHICLL